MAEDSWLGLFYAAQRGALHTQLSPSLTHSTAHVPAHLSPPSWRLVTCLIAFLSQALLFVPVIYSMIGFQAQAEKCFYYFMMFLASISFYTIFGQFMVYVTPSQQVAQVRVPVGTAAVATTC